MTLLKFLGENYSQEVDRESFFFPNLRELAEDNLAGPGEEFELELELLPVTDYYGMERAVIVRESIHTLGWLPEEDMDYWWQLACAVHDAGGTIEVPGRVWTSRDWEKDFYASVRLDMPTMAEAETELENDGVELTAANRKAWTNFSNYIEEYWDPRWVEAHGMSEEEVEKRKEATHREVEEYLAQRKLEQENTSPYGGWQESHVQPSAQLQEPQPDYYHADGGYAPQYIPATHISRPLLWFLWLVLGLFGGHRFYLGNIGIGIIQLFTAGGFGIWWLVDAFIMHNRARALESGAEPRIKF